MPNSLNRYLVPPTISYFLFGPRGTGKSTWLKTHYPDALYVNLLDPNSYQQYAANPNRLHQLIDAHTAHKTIIIDEIQRLPDLLNIVHDRIQKNKTQQFILTGSSARKLKKGGANLLAGRAILKTMHPFMACELKDQFNIIEALSTGLLPVVWDSPNPAETLKTYVGLYIKEEVQAESLTRNIGHFARFLNILSFSHGSILNISNIARECEIDRKRVENYISIVEDLLLGHKLAVFTKKAKRTTIKHNKFYYCDAGLYHALRPKGPLDAAEEMAGPALEGLIYQHLVAWNNYGNHDCTIYYWHTQSGAEVDFIIYGPNHFVAIEVKHSSKINTKDLRHLKTFLQDYPQATGVFIYQGQDRLQIDNIICINATEFLKQLHPRHTQILTP